MTKDQAIELTTNVAALPGVGPARANAFRKLGVRCVADLILHLPYRYERELGERAIGDTNDIVPPEHGSKANVTIRGEVLAVRTRPGRRTRVEATVCDDSGTVLLTWFNAAWIARKIHPGMIIRATGKAQRYGEYLQLTNPRWESIKTDDQDVARAEGDRLRAVYSAGDDITSANIERLIDRVLEPALEQIDDHLPERIRREHALPELREAYRLVHRPTDESDSTRGRRRLAFDELLMLQLGVMMKRLHRRRALRSHPLKHSDAISAHIRERLPFELTTSQETVITEIVDDLAQETPMNRLLQGDVGSGKTAVALYAMLLAVASGHQAALMAPTELLAEQHHATICEMMRGSRVRIELCTGSLSQRRRRDITEALSTGEIDIAIGTHTLFSESSQFKSLSLAVVDEQHRFGVQQRAALRNRNNASSFTEHLLPDDVDAALRNRNNASSFTPHMLVMTATPIPRTLSLTVFGDLDVSTIHGLPPGRMPITTRVVAEHRTNDVYTHMAERLARGEQAYVVVPVVDESEAGLKDVASHAHALRNTHLHAFKVGEIHGRLNRDERDAVMTRFREGEIDALVATIVIEVGVDVPNASMMVIEHAERFGLAQLHQLRGRVGRGSRRSLCVLIGDPKTDEGKARLDAIARTTDGFVIAEKDLEIRGPGELFGTRQSGIAPFRVASLPGDLKLLDLARRDAAAIIREDPTLDAPGHALMRKRLLKAYGETLALVDVA